ncbi:MAG: hypothetical protein H7233_08880 [Pseudorhodobacter sp.]|nr:hypothetical protein [Frankiaceae bacterium]
MTQQLLNDLEVHALLEQEARSCVSHVVHPDRRNAGLEPFLVVKERGTFPAGMTGTAIDWRAPIQSLSTSRSDHR